MGTVNILGRTYEIYGDLAGADIYFGGALASSTWDQASAENKSRSLVTATRLLDRQTWQGSKTDDSQALQWPRQNVVDRNGQPVSSTTVPPQILNGAYELASALLGNPDLENQGNTNNNVRRVRAGSAEVENFRPTSGTRFPTIIQELVGEFLSASQAALSARNFASGLTDRTSFDDDRYEREEGFA